MLLEDSVDAVSWNFISDVKDQVDRTISIARNPFEALARLEWVISRVLRIDAPFVVGADGYGSLIRSILEIPLPSTGPSEVFAVFELRSEAAPSGEMRVIFDDWQSWRKTRWKQLCLHIMTSASVVARQASFFAALRATLVSLRISTLCHCSGYRLPLF